ncbi:MAG: hypothetical protein AAAFM81_01440 [Pseudomonadota bacterium]
MTRRSRNTAHQRGAVLITAIIVSVMAAMLASTSMRSSTYATAMARAHKEHIAVDDAARSAMVDITRRGRFTANQSVVSLRFPASSDIQITAKIERLGETATIALPAFRPARDHDLKVIIYEVEVTAAGDGGYRATVGATLSHIAPARQRTGDVSRRLDIAESRFGTSWWVSSWRIMQ